MVATCGRDNTRRDYLGGGDCQQVSSLLCILQIYSSKAQHFNKALLFIVLLNTYKPQTQQKYFAFVISSESLAFYIGNPGFKFQFWGTGCSNACLKWKSTHAIIVRTLGIAGKTFNSSYNL